FFLLFFFFSSRRRHTRSYGDWSSDVCSSDLDAEHLAARTRRARADADQQASDAGLHQLVGRGLANAVAHHHRRSHLTAQSAEVRSEERRVGKEWRAGWGGDEYKEERCEVGDI